MKIETKKVLTNSRTNVATLSKSRWILLISSDLLMSTERDAFMVTPLVIEGDS
jgi:hypothetical protein